MVAKNRSVLIGGDRLDLRAEMASQESALSGNVQVDGSATPAMLSTRYMNACQRSTF